MHFSIRRVSCHTKHPDPTGNSSPHKTLPSSQHPGSGRLILHRRKGRWECRANANLPSDRLCLSVVDSQFAM